MIYARATVGLVCVLGLGAGLMMGAGCAANPSVGQGPMRVQWEEPIAVAEGGGHRGPWRQNDSAFHFVDDATPALAEDGSVGVVWANQEQQDIYFQRYDGAGEPVMDEPANISRSGEVFSWLPRVVFADEAGERVYVLWQEIIFSGGSHGGEILLARSEDGGQSFSEPMNLSNTTAGAGKGRQTQSSWHNGSLDIVLDERGTIYVAWTEYEGPLWVSRSEDGGASFAEPVHVAGDDDVPARGPALGWDERAEALYLAWTVGEDDRADIRVARSDDGGQSFGEAVVIETPGHADAPKVVVDGASVVHVIYGHAPGGRGQASELHYARSEDGGQAFGEPEVIVEPGDVEAWSVGFAHLGLDGSDRIVVAWEHFERGQWRGRGLGLTWSEDGGRTFEPADVVPGVGEPEGSTSGSQQGLLARKLAVNAAGELAVANSTLVRDESSHVWLVRGRLVEDE